MKESIRKKSTSAQCESLLKTENGERGKSDQSLRFQTK